MRWMGEWEEGVDMRNGGEQKMKCGGGGGGRNRAWERTGITTPPDPLLASAFRGRALATHLGDGIKNGGQGGLGVGFAQSRLLRNAGDEIRLLEVLLR